MTFTTKILPYAVISLSLATARTDTAQGAITLAGVSVSSWLANSLTVITLGGGTLSVKLNNDDNDEIDLSDGMSIAGIPISELYWTNSAQAGLTAKVLIAWID